MQEKEREEKLKAEQAAQNQEKIMVHKDKAIELLLGKPIQEKITPVWN